MKKHCISLALVISSLIVAQAQPYTPDWESLGKHQAVPDWVRDAKFGIYCHWGVYSVPAYGNEQYYNFMHRDSTNDDTFLMGLHRRHEAIYGPLSEFGYHDFIPMFKAEKFDADAWAQLFFESGARFAGLVAEHHDGFSMWDSKYTPWNAKKMGPKRDVVGELEKAIRSRDMKFITTLHHEINYTYVNVKPGWAAYNKKYEKLYGCLMNHDAWQQMFYDKSNEVVDKYHPDLIYFDVGLDQIDEHYLLDFIAHYFNQETLNGQHVALTSKGKELPRDVSMLDMEMSNQKSIAKEPFLCDYTIADGYHKSWGYVKGMHILSDVDIIQKLIEVTANNGTMLLNLAPMADGTIPQDQQDVMANVGVWLWSYGEAIYDTRPFAVSGETVSCRLSAKAHINGKKTVDGQIEDIRVFYTKKGKTVYVILLDWPGDETTLHLSALTPENLGSTIKDATLLSVKKNYKAEWTTTPEGTDLHILKGSRWPSNAAAVIRLQLQ